MRDLRSVACGLGLASLLVACPAARNVEEPKVGGGAPDGGEDASAASEAARTPLDRDAVCSNPVTARARALTGVKVVIPADPHCGEDNYFCDTVDKSPDPKDACYVANDNIRRAERQMSAATNVSKAGPRSPWDGGQAPKYLDRIDAHFHLTREEHEKLKANRFVVIDRLAYRNYAAAFHDVFQEQLPLYVGIDSILHAVFAGTELAIERLERKRLLPALISMVKKLRTTLAASSTLDPETRSDLDIYLGVAAALAPKARLEDYLASQGQPARKLSVLRGAVGDENAAKIEVLETAVLHEGGLQHVSLFGRERMIDFSQFAPRAHYFDYTGPPQLSDYFRTMMWLGRVELNLVSRSSRSSHPGPDLDPSETPREVKDALALAELLERSGASSELRMIDDAYTSFAGRREDVSPAQLLALARKSGARLGDADLAAKLKAAIGDGYKRTARTHFTPEGVSELPAIMTLLGPRIVPDVAPLTRVVHDEVPERKMLGAPDVAWILGHDRARSHVRDFDSRPGLPEAFAKARAELASNAAGAHDVYGSWLRSVLALQKAPAGVVPSFFGKEAYADYRMSSALVGFGQIRHAFVLLAAQGYDAYGCEIPDAFVEPVPAVYDALLAHVRGMRAAVGSRDEWSGLERVLTRLAAIAHGETSGRLLSETERRWLAMVSEHIPNGGFVSTGEPPKWTGWYFDMFEDREHGATASTAFIADYFTLTNAGEVAYLGAEGPRLGVFIVDTNGEPRAMVGPVAKGFETHAPIAGRLDDGKVFAADTVRVAPWRASYAVPERPEPKLELEGQVVHCGEPEAPRGFLVPPAPTATPDAAPRRPAKREWRVAIRSKRAVGATSVVLLDHHGDPLTQKLTFDLGGADEWQVGVFDLPAEIENAPLGISAVHVRVEDLARSHTGVGPFDYVSSASIFSGMDHDPDGKMPIRPMGMSGFEIGMPPQRRAMTTTE